MLSQHQLLVIVVPGVSSRLLHGSQPDACLCCALWHARVQAVKACIVWAADKGLSIDLRSTSGMCSPLSLPPFPPLDPSFLPQGEEAFEQLLLLHKVFSDAKLENGGKT